MRKKEKIWGLILVAPLTLGIIAFVIAPVLFSLFVAFSEYDLINAPKFTGLENLKRIFTDVYFLKSLLKTFFNVLGVPISMAIGLIAALMITKIKFLSGLFRSVFILPAICSSVAVVFMWKYLLNYNYGIVNWLLVKMGFKRVMFLADNLAMPSMIIMGVWGCIGILILLFYAALKNVPRVYYEAAQIDGANAWQQFLRITWPAISPITLYILITQIIGALQDSTRFMVMSGNGSSEDFTTAGVYVYQQTFTFGSPGYASMAAWVLGIIIIIITAINFGLSKKWVSYEN